MSGRSTRRGRAINSSHDAEGRLRRLTGDGAEPPLAVPSATGPVALAAAADALVLAWIHDGGVRYAEGVTAR